MAAPYQRGIEVSESAEWATAQAIFGPARCPRRRAIFQDFDLARPCCRAGSRDPELPWVADELRLGRSRPTLQTLFLFSYKRSFCVPGGEPRYCDTTIDGGGEDRTN